MDHGHSAAGGSLYPRLGVALAFPERGFAHVRGSLWLQHILLWAALSSEPANSCSAGSSIKGLQVRLETGAQGPMLMRNTTVIYN